MPPDPGAAPDPRDPILHLTEHEPPAAEAALLQRRADIAITHSYSLLPRPLPPGCEQRTLFDEPVHLVMHPAVAAGHHLSPGDPADLRDFAEARWLLPDTRTACHEMIQRVCGAAGFTLIPRMALPPHGPDLSVHPLRAPVHRSIHALYRSGTAQHPAIRNVLDRFPTISG
ncbi:hypothetical protein GCM10009550_65630 [Actinocorallia libanotica]|uniref:LysR substrate-binding domain-containing protein n=1 Tax=Actinocorallia libanotica TaxID=46162 RepID=A0ABN1RVU4_9ACTN